MQIGYTQSVLPQNIIIPRHSKIKFFLPQTDTFERTIDIGSSEEFPVGTLSNFTESKFEVDGVKINSMEGFLQSLKTKDKSKQEEICKMVGYQAKKAGRKLQKKQDYDPTVLYWKGKPIQRISLEYQKLLRKAYITKLSSDKTFRDALAATKGAKLTHSVGKSSPYETILTEQEFVNILTELRKLL